MKFNEVTLTALESRTQNFEYFYVFLWRCAFLLFFSYLRTEASTAILLSLYGKEKKYKEDIDLFLLHKMAKKTNKKRPAKEHREKTEDHSMIYFSSQIDVEPQNASLQVANNI